MEISRACVVAEPLPCVQHLVFRSRGKSRDIGKPLHPPVKVRDNRCDGGLLKHQLRDEHGVRIAGATPRQIAPVFAEPRHQRAAESLFGFNHRGAYERIVNVFTAALNDEQAEKLRELLVERGFKFSPKPYTLFFAQKEKLSVAAYEKGPKVVVQGKGTEEFVQFELEPEVLGEARLGYEEVHTPEMFEPHFGIDESGKGDFFGPLVIAGAFVERESARALIDAGVQDSKRIGSDARIHALAKTIRHTLNGGIDVVTIGPARYNELYAKFGNLNALLGWGHARVIENLLAKRPDCPRALSDKFADARVVQNALLQNGRAIRLEQRTKAESDVAVAAASILAREAFIDWLEKRGKALGVQLKRGVSGAVKDAARKIVEAQGPAALAEFAKVHFRTAHEVAPEFFPAPPPRREWRR